METCKQLSPLVAVQQALKLRQLVVLRDWLGDDHELLAWADPVAFRDPPASQPAAQQPEEMSA
jgi:hypothetical protein